MRMLLLTFLVLGNLALSYAAENEVIHKCKLRVNYDLNMVTPLKDSKVELNEDIVFDLIPDKRSYVKMKGRITGTEYTFMIGIADWPDKNGYDYDLKLFSGDYKVEENGSMILYNSHDIFGDFSGDIGKNKSFYHAYSNQNSSGGFQIYCFLGLDNGGVNSQRNGQLKFPIGPIPTDSEKSSGTDE